MANFTFQCSERSAFTKPEGPRLTITSPSHSSYRPASLGRPSAQARNSSAVILCLGSVIIGRSVSHAATLYSMRRRLGQAKRRPNTCQGGVLNVLGLPPALVDPNLRLVG